MIKIIIIFILLILIIVFIIKKNELFADYIGPMPMKDNYKCIKDLDLGEKLPLNEQNLKKIYTMCNKNKQCKGIYNNNNIISGCSEIEKLDDNVSDPKQLWGKHPERIHADVEFRGNVGVDENSNSNFIATIKGSINLKKSNSYDNVICLEDRYGLECLNTDDIYHINKLPVTYEENEVICLNDNRGNPVCVSKDQLAMLTGQKSFKLKNINTGNPSQNSYLKNTEYTIPRGALAIQNYAGNMNYFEGKTVEYYKLVTNSGTDFSIRPPFNYSGKGVLEYYYK